MTNHHQHSWSPGNDEEASREEPTTPEMLYNRVKQLSDRVHSELRPSQDYRHYSSRRNEDFTADSDDLTLDHSSRYSREGSSSRNSTLMDETSLNTSDEDKDAALRDSASRELNSRALVVYFEANESRLSNTEEQEKLCEDLECNGGSTVGCGSDRGYSQRSSGDRGGGGSDPHKPHVSTDDIDPKLHKALEKMRKLDEKLANVTKVSRILLKIT